MAIKAQKYMRYIWGFPLLVLLFHKQIIMEINVTQRLALMLFIVKISSSFKKVFPRDTFLYKNFYKRTCDR